MENLEWPALGHVATSSPKKRERGTKPKLSRSFEVRDKDNGNGESNVNLELGEFNFEFSDAEIVSHSRTLSPVRSANTSRVFEETKHNESQKVTSFNSSNHDKPDCEEDDLSDEEVNESVDSVKSEAETTIQKVKEFIESKRQEMNKERQLKATRHKVNAVIPHKIIPTHKVTKVEHRKSSKESKHAKVANSKISEHRKTLRRLIHDIHKLPYDVDWKIEEWQLFQEYLNEWKLSDDDDMFQPVVLQDLFNCEVSEIETRIKSLKKFIDWKQKSDVNGNV